MAMGAMWRVPQPALPQAARMLLLPKCPLFLSDHVQQLGYLNNTPGQGCANKIGLERRVFCSYRVSSPPM